MFEHFGRAPYYAIVSIEGNNVLETKFIENPSIESHEPGAIPQLLYENGVNVIIVLAMGRRARFFFEQFGIQVITGVGGKLSEVINAYIQGTLESRPYEPREKWKHSH